VQRSHLCWKEKRLFGLVFLVASSRLLLCSRPTAGETGVAEAVRTQTTLEVLIIHKDWFEDDDAEELGTVLVQNTSLKELRLTGVAFTERGWRSIMEALKINRTLTQLQFHHEPRDNLIRFPMDNALAGILADMLFSNSSLEILSLSCCSVGALGWRAIANALKKNTSLEVLTILWDDSANAGALALAEALASTTSLRQLWLGKCDIGEQGALALGRAWGSNLALPLVLNVVVHGVVQGVMGVKQEADRVRGLILLDLFRIRKEQQLVTFGMAMIPRLGGGPGEETTSAESSSEACVFHLMDGDVFKLIGEAYGDYRNEASY
jgi:Ran GTPase-activating protein (RanGAP) involved in mRNA processing and transport